MTGRRVAALLLLSLFLAVGGDAQNRETGEKPVWTLEFIQVQPEKFGMAMGYLDDYWMRVRAEAKKQGAVLDYHRIQNAMLVAPGHKVGDPTSVVLLTEFKNMDAYMGSEKLFASIREHLPQNAPGMIKLPQRVDFYKTWDTQVFVEDPDAGTRFKLLAER